MTHAEDDGFHAFNDGCVLSDNPYAAKELADEWRKGWLRAEKAQDERNDDRWFRG